MKVASLLVFYSIGIWPVSRKGIQEEFLEGGGPSTCIFCESWLHPLFENQLRSNLDLVPS
jgi:hypothetical protein